MWPFLTFHVGKYTLGYGESENLTGGFCVVEEFFEFITHLVFSKVAFSVSMKNTSHLPEPTLRKTMGMEVASLKRTAASESYLKMDGTGRR